MDEQNRARAEADREVQQELERQLRALGTAAAGVGRAAAKAADRGIDRAQQAVKDEWDRTWQAAGTWRGNAADRLRASAKKRRGAGLAMVLAGGVLAFHLGCGALAVLGAAAQFAPSAVAADVLLGGTLAVQITSELLLEFGSAALAALRAVGGVLLAGAAGFGYMIWAGAKRLRAARWLERCADTVRDIDQADGISLELLKTKPDEAPRKTLKTVRGYLQKGWLPAWLDAEAERLYFTAESYRAAQEAKRAPRPQPEPEAQPANADTARRFVQELGAQRAQMRDERAAEELAQMQTTAQAICDWLEKHPESEPKARRFAEYYIPTTRKLLHTYHDVQGQSGENAEAIRRDIAGILHTLNRAYANLYDSLLSDMALDVSGEIAALEGMLANDGLAGEALR